MQNCFTPSKIVLYFCLSFCCGVFLASYFNFSLISIFIILIFSLILIGPLYCHWRIFICGFCFLFFALGIFRTNYFDIEPQNNVKLLFQNEIKFKALVCQEPLRNQGNTQLVVSIKEIDGFPLKNFGKILIITDSYPQYQYADFLEISGKITPPKNFSAFDYKDYLKKEKIYSSVYYPAIEILSQNNYSNFFEKIYGKILIFKEKLRAEIQKKLPHDQGWLLSAIILGDKNQLSSQLKTKLNITGLSHITAISGMNIVLLSQIIFLILISLGFWRKQSLAISLGLIWLYIFLVGFQPSVVRAGIMASFFNLAGLFDRQNSSGRSIIFAATAMLAFNPLLLTKDVGFQLSFLAILGIIIFYPFFKNLFKNLPQFLDIKGILAMTFSAQVLTLPILIYNFGYVSLVSPITNILVVPMLSYIMFFGILFPLASLIFPFLGWLFALPCLSLLIYLLWVVNFFSKFPVALKISFGWLIIFYLLLFFLFYKYKRRVQYL